jgi:plasmid stability protein
VALVIEETVMGSLSVRRPDKETLEHLRVRTAEHGVSMEEEARRILADAVAAPRRLGDMAVSLFGAACGEELELSARPPNEPMAFRQ